MSDDLKTRIAVFVEKECNLEASIPALFLKAIALLYDCLARIEKLEWENKLFRDRLKELDTCHPDYGVSLEAAKKRIVELEQENARLGLAAGNECREHTANENQLKADLEAAERLLPTIKHDEEFVWLVIQNGLINLCALSPITSMRFLEWAGKVDAYFQAKEKR